jgi:hypothetical protein
LAYKINKSMKKVADYLSNSIKEKLFLLKLVAYITLPIIVYMLPIDYFDKGETVCLSMRLANIECYACGMTSAVKHLLHFDFETAYAYNMLSFVVTPLLSIMWVGWFWKDAKYYYSYRQQLKMQQQP